jgi:DNA-binding SARP family transcriptional activator
MDADSFYLKTLGQLALHESGPSGPVILSNKKPLAVLAILATMPGSTASREYLAELLWPGVEHDRARRSLRQALYQLSKEVGQELVVASDITLSLNRELLAVDLWAFDRAMEERDYARGVKLCDGPFLAGMEGKAGRELSRWVEAQNERLDAALEVAYAQTIAEAVRAGDLESAVEHAQANAARNPLDEGGQVLLVRTLRAAGRDVEALQSYQGYRKLLAGELGAEPGEELERSAARVQEALLAPLEGALESGLNGLAAALIDARDPEVARPRWQTAAIGGVGGAAVLAVGLLGWAALFEGGGTIRPLDDLHGTLMVEVPGLELVELELQGRDVEERSGRSVESPEFYVPSPDGSLVAQTVDAPDGVNTAIRKLAGGEVNVMAEGPDDEYPVAWSPDGRYLLYTYGRLMDDSVTYVYRLGIHDVVTQARRTLTERPFSSSDRFGAWSPDGTRIAFTGWDGELPRYYIVNFDGSGERAVSPEGLWAQGAAWSPDGAYIAFAGRSVGFTSVYVGRPDGSGLRQVSRAAADYWEPIWVSDRVVATVSDRAGARDIWAVDVLTGEERRLTDRGDIVQIVPPFRRGEQRRWIDDLAIQAGDEVVTPGQRVALDAVLTDPSGEILTDELVPIRWSLVEGSAAELVERARLEVTGLGVIEIIASAAGWRADTLELISRPLVERQLEAVYSEDWREGLRTEDWIVFGLPLPYARSSGGPEGGGIFVSNGDQSYTSGAVSRRSFPLAAGLTVEVWGRMPFSGRHYEDLKLDLLVDPLPSDSTDWASRHTQATILRFAVAGYRLSAGLQRPKVSGSLETAPYPAEPEGWHRYALQIEPDGRVSLLYDGALKLHSAQRLPVDSITQVHIGLAGASYNTEIMHGPVAVYRGTKYELPRSGN